MPPPMGSMPPPPGMMFPPGMPPVSAPGTPAMPPAEEIWVENKTPDGKVSPGQGGCPGAPSLGGPWLTGPLSPGLFLQRAHARVGVEQARRGQGHPAGRADAHAGGPGPGRGGLHPHHQQPRVRGVSVHLLQHAVLHHLHHHHGHLGVPDQLQWVPGRGWAWPWGSSWWGCCVGSCCSKAWGFRTKLFQHGVWI